MTTDRNGHVHGTDGRYSVKQQGEPGVDVALAPAPVADPLSVMGDRDARDEIAYETAHSVADQYASTVNNGGVGDQIAFLRSRGFSDADIAGIFEPQGLPAYVEDGLLDETVYEAANEYASTLYNDGVEHELIGDAVAVDLDKRAPEHAFTGPGDPLWRYVGAARIDDEDLRDAYIEATGPGFGPGRGVGSDEQVEAFLRLHSIDPRDNPTAAAGVAAAFGRPEHATSRDDEPCGCSWSTRDTGDGRMIRVFDRCARHYVESLH